jgi:hypothetical protein
VRRPPQEEQRKLLILVAAFLLATDRLGAIHSPSVAPSLAALRDQVVAKLGPYSEGGHRIDFQLTVTGTTACGDQVLREIG